MRKQDKHYLGQLSIVCGIMLAVVIPILYYAMNYGKTGIYTTNFMEVATIIVTGCVIGVFSNFLLLVLSSDKEKS